MIWSHLPHGITLSTTRAPHNGLPYHACTTGVQHHAPPYHASITSAQHNEVRHNERSSSAADWQKKRADPIPQLPNGAAVQLAASAHKNGQNADDLAREAVGWYGVFGGLARRSGLRVA